MNNETNAKEKPELVFADLTLGREFRALEYPITRKLVEDFMEVVGDNHPLYTHRDTGTALAPPGLAAIYARSSYLQDHTMPSGGILAKQEFEFINPIKIGDTLTVRAKVTESLLDEKGRKRVTFLISAKNQKGMDISEVTLGAIWPK
jgi:acyl dehydratase